MRPEKATDRRAAFTLIEMLVVLVIMAFAAAMVVPMVVGVGGVQALSATRIIVSDLQYAQNYAITNQRQTTVEFLDGKASYKLYNASETLKHPMTNKDYVVELVGQQGLNELVPLDAQFATPLKVTFDELGSPDNGGYVNVQGGKDKFRIDVAAVTGTITYRQVGP